MTPDDGPLPPPLPVRVRPAAGETTESYIRRLARANYLRPSLLQVYVRNPDVPTGAIRLRRLAAVSGSTRTALSFALTGLTPAIEANRPPPSPAESQAARKARLFGIIRDDAARGMSIRQIAGRRHVHRRMVRQALAEPAGPSPRKRGTRPAPALSPIRNVLDKLAGEPLTVWEIWTTVTDEHDSDASYATIRDYIRTRRLAGQLGPHPRPDHDERPDPATRMSPMDWPARFPAEMRAGTISVRPYESADAAELFGSLEDERAWEHIPRAIPADAAALDESIRSKLADGNRATFIVRQGGRVVGMTSVLFDPHDPAGAEVGGTQLDPGVWGTGVNTEVKRLLFEVIFHHGAQWVQLRTDERNGRSAAAIRKLGAADLGVHQDHRVRRDGTRRQSRIFRLDRPGSSSMRT